MKRYHQLVIKHKKLAKLAKEHQLLLKRFNEAKTAKKKKELYFKSKIVMQKIARLNSK